jgi:predicted alpha-1,6-mannanase (GH76 family)
MSRGRIIAAAAVILTVIALGLVIGLRPSRTPSAAGSPRATPLPRATGPLTADSALQYFDGAFLMQSNGSGYYRLTTAGRFASFFKQAEMIEMMEDAYLRSHDPQYKAMIGVLFKGLIARHSSDWLHNPSSDDLMWAYIMCLRAYAITGDKAYLKQARTTFDRTYARAWSSALGGGLWNTNRRIGKNTCVNAPAVIAAGMLYQALHQASYLTKAKTLYRWLHTRLYDPGTGAVYDHVSPGSGKAGVVDRTAYTYNQGGFIGAADVLYKITADRRYYADGLKALQFAKDHLTVDGILKSETAANPSLWASSGGFKGMFVRWASIFINDNHISGYTAWFQQNASSVVSHANVNGLMNENWPAQTGTGTLLAFSCSSAVVLLQWYQPPAR